MDPSGDDVECIFTMLEIVIIVSGCLFIEPQGEPEPLSQQVGRAEWPGPEWPKVSYRFSLLRSKLPSVYTGLTGLHPRAMCHRNVVWVGTT